MSSGTETEINNTLEKDFQLILQLRDYLNRVIKGKKEIIDYVIVCLLSRGHLLLEDKPGLGKTTLAKALSTAIGGMFSRVQCTPDLLPSDITGFNIFNQKTNEFEFRKGPVFADVMLVDEINRATPRTQSALLEAMAERQVTVDAVQYELSRDFFVIATQNPIDQHGTYPLPEAQLDRFSMKLSIGYPDQSDELRMLQSAISTESSDSELEQSIFNEKTLLRMQEEVSRITVTQSIQEYFLRIANASRSHSQISLGISPRAVLVWQRVAQAYAFLNQRDYVVPEDVKATSKPVLCVRLGVYHEDSDSVIDELFSTIEIPKYELKM